MSSELTDRLVRDAAANVRDEYQRLDIPEFSAGRRRSPALVAIMLLLVSAGGFLWLRSVSTGEQTQVATDGTETPAPTLVTALDVRVPQSIPRPEAGQKISDPAFGTTITRLTGSAAEQYVVPVQSPWSAWNSDETRLLLYRTTIDGDGSHQLYDTTTNRFVVELAIEPTDIEQVFWSRTNPDVVFYFDDNDLVSFDVATLSATTVQSFDQCLRIDPGNDGSAISDDGDRMGFWCEQDLGAVLIAYRFSTGEIITKPTDGSQAPLVAPSGERFVLPLPDGGAEVLDANLAPTGVRLNTGPDVFSFVATSDGRELLVGPSYDGDIVGSLVAFDLDTGAAEVIVGPDSDHPYPPSGARVSAANGRVAIAMLGISNNDEWAVLDGEILVVDFKTDSPTIFRVAHDRTSGTIDFWSSAFVSISPSGDRIAFSSDWGLSDQVDTYIVTTNQ